MVHLVHPNGSVSCLQDQLVCHIDQFFTCLQNQSVCYRKHNTPHVPTRGSVSYLFSGSISLSWKRHSTPHAPQSVSFLPAFRINQFVMEETQYTSCTDSFLPVFRINQSVVEDTVHLVHPQVDQFFLPVFRINQSVVEDTIHGTPCAPTGGSVFLPVFRINQSVVEDTVHGTPCAPTGGSVFLPVFWINQSVVEDTVHLVHPKADQLLSLCHAGAGHKKHPTNDAGEVTQVEDVVWLGRCGEELGDWVLVHIHGGRHHQLWKGKQTLRPCNT